MHLPERFFLSRPRRFGKSLFVDTLASLDAERIDPVTLLFQSGYLSIKAVCTDLGQSLFRLGVPNTEVKLALNNQFFNVYTDLSAERLGIQQILHNQRASGDLRGLVGIVERLFAAIPWRNFTHNNLASNEGYYASVLYTFFSSLDAQVIAEDISNHGQVDLTVMRAHHVELIGITAQRHPAQPDPVQLGFGRMRSPAGAAQPLRSLPPADAVRWSRERPQSRRLASGSAHCALALQHRDVALASERTCIVFFNHLHTCACVACQRKDVDAMTIE